MQEATTLIQHNKYSQEEKLLTIILFGKEYWKGLTLQYEKLFERNYKGTFKELIYLRSFI